MARPECTERAADEWERSRGASHQRRGRCHRGLIAPTVRDQGAWRLSVRVGSVVGCSAFVAGFAGVPNSSRPNDPDGQRGVACELRVRPPEVVAMKLYYVPGASSLAVHIALREAERRFELERFGKRAVHDQPWSADTLRDPSAQPDHAPGTGLLPGDPHGHVPVLELDSPQGAVLTQVAAILQYVADLAPEKQLAPANGTLGRYHLQSWLAFIGSELEPLFVAMSEAGRRRGNGGEWSAVLRGKLSERLIYIEDVLVDRAFLLGETFSVADAYLFVILRWADAVGCDLQLYPNVDNYEFRIEGRPAVAASLAAEGLVGRHVPAVHPPPTVGHAG
jgi:glutathione S-transferase